MRMYDDSTLVKAMVEMSAFMNRVDAWRCSLEAGQDLS
jgi:hypothetical protein